MIGQYTLKPDTHSNRDTGIATDRVRVPSPMIGQYLNRVCTGQSSYSERASTEWQSSDVTPQVNLSFSFVSRVLKNC